LNFADALGHPLSPLQWTSGIANPFSTKIFDRIDSVITYGIQYAAPSANAKGAAENIINNYEAIVNQHGPFQAWTVIETQTLAEELHFLGFGKHRQWVNNPQLITPVHDGPLMSGLYKTAESACKGAAIVLKQQLSSRNLQSIIRL
jgi:hypothetical protein